MKYGVHRQFTKKIWTDPQTYEDLSTERTQNGIRNVVKDSKVEGQVDGLEVKVIYTSTEKPKELSRKRVYDILQGL